jgi:hypothetical protein
MDEYDIYSKKEPRALGDVRFRERGMPEYRKTIWEATMKDIRPSGFHYYNDLLDGTRARRKKGILPMLGFNSDTWCCLYDRQCHLALIVRLSALVAKRRHRTP